MERGKGIASHEYGCTSLEQESTNFYVKGQIVNILGFVGHKSFVTSFLSQLLHFAIVS